MIDHFNTINELIAYFNVSIEEFREFWKSLTSDEKMYYHAITLN